MPTESLEHAVAILARGGLVAYPTETFYGLGADATNAAAVARLGTLKGRSPGKPIACLAADVAQAGQLAALSEPALRLAARFWPGALTLVLPARPGLPPELVGEGFVGVRVSAHPLARQLADALGHPLTATSANLAGGVEVTRCQDLDPGLLAAIDGVVDGGATPGGLASTLVRLDVAGPALLRAGAVAFADVLATLAAGTE